MQLRNFPFLNSLFFRTVVQDEQEATMRKIAYSMDLLIPGIYLWWGKLRLTLGGVMPDDTPEAYPGMIHRQRGLAIVLPGYHIWTTYQDSYDPR